MTTGVAFHIFPPTEKSRDALRRKTSLKHESKAKLSEPLMPLGGLQEVNVVVATEERTPTLHEFQLDIPEISEPVAIQASNDISSARSTLSPILSQDEVRVASPAFSEAATAISGTTALGRSNSCATERTVVETPPIRSIFPQYDHSLPLSLQQYRPALPSPTHIPQEKINKHVACSNDILTFVYNSAEASSSSQPSYTPESEFPRLWDIANGKSTSTSPRSYSLKLHRQEARFKSKKASKASDGLKFGASSLEPFYSLVDSAVSPEDEAILQSLGQTSEREIIVHRHHPTKPRSIPIAHLNLSAPPAFPYLGSGMGKEVKSTVITTIYPKLAALLAIDAAAHSPAANEIALLDPTASSPAAAHLAQEAVRENSLRESCSLFWESDPAAITLGHYKLHHPVLGSFAVALSGDVATSYNTATASQSYPTLQQNARAARVEIRAPGPQEEASSSMPSTSPSSFSPLSASPSSIQKPFRPASANLPGPLLATLDFTTDTLHLNIGEIVLLNNPHLPDILVTTLLAVCVSESRRAAAIGTATAFAGPPSAKMADKLAKEENKRLRKGGADRGSASHAGKTHLYTSTASASSTASKFFNLTRRTLTSTRDLKELNDLRGLGQDMRTKSYKGKGKQIDRAIELATTSIADGINGVNATPFAPATFTGGAGSGAGMTAAGKGWHSSEQISSLQNLPRVTRGILTGLGLGLTAAVYTVGAAAKVAAGTVVVVSEAVSSGGGRR